MTEQPSTPADDGHFHTVSAQRNLRASVDDIWRAWSEPVPLSHWFTSDAEHDFRVGGRYRNGDGDEGEYLEIIPQQRIVFTWEQPDYSPGSLVAVDLIPNESTGTVLVSIRHDRVGCDDTEDLEIGWNWALDSLGRYLETGLGIAFEEWAAMRGMV